MACIVSRLNPAKRSLALAFFFFTGLSLFAQTFREARIYIPPIMGTGTMEDNAFFYKQLAFEVVLQYHSLVRSRYGSDFILSGSIAPYTGEEQDPQEESEYLRGRNEFTGQGPVPERPIPRIRNTYGRREFFSWEIEGNILFFDTTGEGNYSPQRENETRVEESAPVSEDSSQDQNEFVFTLELIDSSTGEAIGRQSLIYSITDSRVGELVSVLVYYMLVGIPDIEETDDWRNNRLFLNINGIWAPLVYADQTQPVNLIKWVNFGLSVQAEYRFTDLLSAGLGVRFVQDEIATAAGNEYRDLLMEIPLSLKLVFKPLDYLTLEPYAGASLNLSLTGTTQPNLFSWFLGLQFGIKAGSGMIVIDPGFSMDFGRSPVPQSSVEYQRYMIRLGVGYKFNIFSNTSKPGYY